MSFDLVLTLSITVLVLLGFVLQWGTVDLIALVCLVSLSLFGIISPTEALKGFSNPATITVLAMFILSEAVSTTGALNIVGQKILNISYGKKQLAMLYLMLFVGIASMFINNTAAVALLIPVSLQISKSAGWNPSSLLMPLSFASMVGGVCTLIGTSTNLLADSILIESGYEGFSIFSFFNYGIIFFVVGLVYILLTFDKLVPKRRKDLSETESYELQNYLTSIRILPGCPYIGLDLDSSDQETSFQIINRVETQNPKIDEISEGDILYIAADLDTLKEFTASKFIEILPSIENENDNSLGAKRKLIEAVVSPDSKIVNERLKNVHLFKRFGIKVLAIRHRQTVEKYGLSNVKIRSGDMLVMAVPVDQIDRLRESKLFVLIREPQLAMQKTNKIIPTIVIMGLVVLLAFAGIVPIYISALLGVCLTVIFKILTLDEAYQAVNWRIIFLLAGLLALGKALENSGATQLISTYLLDYLQSYGKMAIIAGFFSLSIVLTSILSNNAAAVILVPIAIESARSIGMDATKLVICVMFASSLCFLTPIGYQTNMMVYGVGQYKFIDFLRFGGPLTILMLITSLFVFS